MSAKLLLENPLILLRIDGFDCSRLDRPTEKIRAQAELERGTLDKKLYPAMVNTARKRTCPVIILL
jgi:hypothetical protein